MIDDTVRKIENRIQQAHRLTPEKRKELLGLIADLKAEMTGVSETDMDQARSIAGFADVSTHEAMRTEKKPQAFQHAVDGLSSSVADFEKTHPKLVEAVNRVTTALANLGI